MRFHLVYDVHFSTPHWAKPDVPGAELNACAAWFKTGCGQAIYGFIQARSDPGLVRCPDCQAALVAQYLKDEEATERFLAKCEEMEVRFLDYSPITKVTKVSE